MTLALTFETAFGAIAAFASLLGVVLTVAGYITGRKNAAEQAVQACHEQLLAEQRVSEGLSRELHELRMHQHVREP